MVFYSRYHSFVSFNQERSSVRTEVSNIQWRHVTMARKVRPIQKRYRFDTTNWRCQYNIPEDSCNRESHDGHFRIRLLWSDVWRRSKDVKTGIRQTLNCSKQRTWTTYGTSHLYRCTTRRVHPLLSDHLFSSLSLPVTELPSKSIQCITARTSGADSSIEYDRSMVDAHGEANKGQANTDKFQRLAQRQCRVH